MAGFGVLWRVFDMLKIIKSLCFFAIMLVGFLVPAAAEIGYSENPPPKFALILTMMSLWWPSPFISLLVLVLGGLVFVMVNMRSARGLV